VRVAVFRWKAIGPLSLLGAAVLGLWLVFADPIAKRSAESVGTTLVGAEVAIERLHLDLAHGRVEIHGLTVASPFEALQNLFHADALVADLDPLPLLEKKVVIDRLTATGLKFGTPRLTDGRTGGRSDGVIGQVTRWANSSEYPPWRSRRARSAQHDWTPRNSPRPVPPRRSAPAPIRRGRRGTPSSRGSMSQPPSTLPARW